MNKTNSPFEHYLMQQGPFNVSKGITQAYLHFIMIILARTDQMGGKLEMGRRILSLL